MGESGKKGSKGIKDWATGLTQATSVVMSL
jgi:hypothetical protein